MSGEGNCPGDGGKKEAARIFMGEKKWPIHILKEMWFIVELESIATETKSYPCEDWAGGSSIWVSWVFMAPVL